MLNICEKFSFGFTNAPEVDVVGDTAIGNHFNPQPLKEDLNK